MRQNQPGVIAGGLGLLLVGIWLLAITLAPLSGLQRLWPLIPAIFGLVMLVQASSEEGKPDGMIFLGVIALLTGLFLLLFTFRIGRLTWYDMNRYWPGFPLIVGIAFMVLYLAKDMRQQALLAPTFIIGGVGIFALPFTLGVIGGPVFSQVLQFWPLLAILALLAILFRPRPRVRSKGANTTSDTEG